jgi:hypothetical protein
MVIPLFAFIGVFLSLKHADAVAQLGFFRAAATIIPTLLLALAVHRFFWTGEERSLSDFPFQGSFFRSPIFRAFLRVDKALLPLGRFMTFGYIAIGEATALLALANSKPPDNTLTSIAAGALAAAFAAIGLLAVSSQPQTRSSP